VSSIVLCLDRSDPSAAATFSNLTRFSPDRETLPACSRKGRLAAGMGRWHRSCQEPSMTDAEILANLKRLRTERGLTQHDLAELAGTSEVTIGRYENQGARPSGRTMAKLKTALGIIASDQGSPDRELRSIRHTFHLRPDVSVSFDLPEDLTSAEADRLAGFIKSLPF
jgi:transcriptional regulator with XRE-family HTH domain